MKTIGMEVGGLTTCRRTRWTRIWSLVTMIAMVMYTVGGPGFIPTVQAQTAPVGAGFELDAGDLRFILRQIGIAEAHAAGGALFGPGPSQVNDYRFPFGLRTVDGSFNHLRPGSETNGASDQLFPRLTTPNFRQAESLTAAEAALVGQAAGPTAYTQKSGFVADSQPRVISNLIIDQTANNPAALFVASALAGEDAPTADPDSFTLPILNTAPDVGLSAPFNSMFTFFGQFFDHGLDLTNKGGGTVFVPLKADDSLLNVGPNFMMLTRATNQPGPDGILGNADDVQEATNQTTPFVDQNQTYTSHPSHQVFLREYRMSAGRPVSTGKMIDGGGNTASGAPVKNIGSWGEVKAQAAAMLGIGLVDADVFNAPKLETDLYGRFLRGPAGFPLMEMAVGPSVEGNPAAPISTANARRTGHGFLDDIAHNAAPKPGLVADGDTDVSVFGPGAAPQPAGTYDDELLNAHFVTGDGRGNENIALTSVHTVFHAEHNRLADKIHEHLNTPGFGLSADELAAWGAQSAQPPLGSGWDYGERLFQAARFVTEMEYQHLVFEEFARKISPSINAFIGDGINFQSNANPAISAEFAHQVYRLGHSMLTETIARTSATDEAYDIRLLDGFLNPLEFNRGADGAQLTAAQGAGAVFQGGTRQVASEIDEFVTDAVRNTLVGLPLDLAVLNMARGRSEGIPSLNSVRRQLYTASGDTQLVPYESWFDFSFSMRNPKSVVNFIAAYGTHPSITGATSVAAKRTAAELLADGGTGAPSDWPDFLFGTGAYANAANGATTTGLDNIDLWIGGLAERGNPFGGLLGSTFNYIFETQLESLQNLDRFYYLERLDGLNLLAQLEANSFSELISRNTTLTAAGADVFARPDMIFHLAAQNVSGPIVNDPQTPDVDESAELVRMPNGTIRYPGDKHVIWVGRNDAIGDRVISSEGDDTLRGNGGNDVMEGGSGNDQHIGGDGDDILTDTFGDDVLKGGPGNDAINGGAGPFDLLQGNGGNDFIVGGIDDSEVFGGSGNDVIYMGKGISESFGGGGDDWIEGTDVPASVVVGDENDQFQNNPNGGHDILLAGPGDADFDSEGGDDIMVGNVVPTHRFEGMLGFDWATYRGETVAVDADMNITGAIAINAPLNEGRDRYDSIEALSGTDFNDLLRGDDRVEADLRLDPITEVVNGHVLTSAGIARISGLAALLPAGATEFAAGNIILGGAGSDLIEGRGGDDIIDGDAWLDVQLRGVLNPTVPGGVGEVKLANTHVALRNDVFAGRLNPGNITLVRAIRIAPVTTPRAIDSAVFSGPLANYTITENANGTVTVADNVGLDGVDTLRRIERAVFTDTTLVVNNVAPTGAPVLSQLRPQEGETLSASTAGIADENGLVGVVFNFRWQQRLNAGAFLNIAGARGAAATFTPTQAEVGRSLRVLVTFTDEGGALEFVVSAPTGVVGDVFVGTEANDTFAGTAGRDNASGLGGNDTLNTGNEDDVVLGGAGDDAINTGANNDIIRVDGGAGFDNVNGGTGTDRIEAMSAGTVIGLTALAGVESITANGFAGVTIQGSEAANTLSFAAVTLTNIGSINGGGGNDVLTGTALVDTINGGTGGDTVNGGAGNDVLRGDDGNDIVNGGTGDDNIAGNLGNDTINGDAGNDVISGGSEDDTILGGAGNDAIDGNDGDDTVTGGTGNDTMNAAAGNDVFVFNAAFNTDVINGFDTDEQQGQDELNLAALGITAANFNTNVTQVIQVVGGVSSMLITVRNPATGATLGTIRLNGVLRLGEVTPAGGSFILAP